MQFPVQDKVPLVSVVVPGRRAPGSAGNVRLLSPQLAAVVHFDGRHLAHALTSFCRLLTHFHFANHFQTLYRVGQKNRTIFESM